MAGTIRESVERVNISQRGSDSWESVEFSFVNTKWTRAEEWSVNRESFENFLQTHKIVYCFGEEKQLECIYENFSGSKINKVIKGAIRFAERCPRFTKVKSLGLENIWYK